MLLECQFKKNDESVPNFFSCAFLVMSRRVFFLIEYDLLGNLVFIFPSGIIFLWNSICFKCLSLLLSLKDEARAFCMFCY